MKKDQATHYAICAFCKQRMAPGHGCEITHLEFDDERYPRIKVGDEGDTFHDMDEEIVCHDCNAKKGEYHHVGCAQDRCPLCRGQFFLCGCVPYAYINPSADDYLL